MFTLLNQANRFGLLRTNTDMIYLRDVELSSPPVDGSLSSCYHRIRSGESCFSISELPTLVQLILRNHLWGRLIAQHMACQFGWDFYAYILFDKHKFPHILDLDPHGLYLEPMENVDV